MRKHWQAIEERFARFNMREQILVSLACLALAYAIGDILITGPVSAKRDRTAREVVQKQKDAETLSVQITQFARQPIQDPNAENRRRLAELQSQLANAQNAIKEQSALLVPAERMSNLLERLLAKHPNLELVELKTVPSSVLELGKNPKPPVKADPGKRPPEAGIGQDGELDAARGIHKFGLDLSIKGGYLDILEYLRDIESLPGRIYWERMELAATDFPVTTLKLKLYTLSFDSVWMKV